MVRDFLGTIFCEVDYDGITFTEVETLVMQHGINHCCLLRTTQEDRNLS